VRFFYEHGWNSTGSVAFLSCRGDGVARDTLLLVEQEPGAVLLAFLW
jgi:hypothetical protein